MRLYVAALIGPLLFVNYLPSLKLDMKYERKLQAALTARLVEEMVAGRNLRMVLTGDLDADPDAISVRFWTGRQGSDDMSVCYRDVWESAHPGEPGPILTPRNPLMGDRDWSFR